MKVSTLIVDDKESIRRSLKKALSREGIYTIQNPTDIVISDLEMPGMEVSHC